MKKYLIPTFREKLATYLWEWQLLKNCKKHENMHFLFHIPFQSNAF